MNPSFVESAQGLSESQLGGFFVGWPNPPSPATHLRILHQSQHVVLAMEGERVIGFITAISDGVLSAYIPLLEVLPSHQGRGIGAELVKRMLARLEDLYMVDLLCDAELQPFYQKLGMHQARGMLQRNYQRQNGL